MDPYTTLEVPHDATLEQIKKAYRKLALKWHPDKNGGSLEAAEMFRKVKAASECHLDPIKREAEDHRREEAEADKQARARANEQTVGHATSQPQAWRWAMNPLAVGLALFALIFIIVALFNNSNHHSSSTTA